MPTTYPAAVDTFAFIGEQTRENEINHDERHNNEADAIVALQEYIGTQDATGPASLTGRVTALEAGGVGGAPALHYRSDDLTAAAGDVRFLLAAAPYQSAVQVFADGLRIAPTALTGSGRQRFLPSPATAGTVYTVDYWTMTASPGATLIDDIAELTLTLNLINPKVGVAYADAAIASGGVPPYTFALLDGPAWLSLNPSTGALTGTPTAIASGVVVHVEMTDSAGDTADAIATVDVELIEPHWANVVSLLRCDGTAGSTSFPDLKGKAWTVQGGAVVTATSRFGSGALATPSASGAHLVSPPSPDFDFGAGEFTVEGWVRRGSPPGTFSTVFGMWASPHANGYWLLGSDSSGRLSFALAQVNAFNFAVQSETGVLAQGVYSHVALCRTSGVIRGFVDGVQVFSLNNSTQVGSSSIGFYVGKYEAGGQWDGVVDEIRITKGVGRYTANFTPPNAPFPGI